MSYYEFATHLYSFIAFKIFEKFINFDESIKIGRFYKMSFEKAWEKEKDISLIKAYNSVFLKGG